LHIIAVCFVNLHTLKNEKMKLIFLTIGLLAIAFAGIAIKIWAKKDGKFSGTCASQSPFLNKDGESCGYCGKTSEEMKDCSGDNSNS
jgi:hypothetical protein